MHDDWEMLKLIFKRGIKISHFSFSKQDSGKLLFSERKTLLEMDVGQFNAKQNIDLN